MNRLSKAFEIVTEAELKEAFENTNFGETSNRDVINYNLLKITCGFHIGFTARSILKELQLLHPNNLLTKKGGEYLYEVFGAHSNV